MSDWSFTVGRDELFAVGDLLSAHRPAEIAGEGVWVRVEGGRRVWSVRTDDVVWEVDGAAVDRPLPARCLPDRLVWNARLFTVLDGTVEVTIEIPDDEVAIAQSEVGRCVIDLPDHTEVPVVGAPDDDAATAMTAVATVLDLVRRAAIAPWAPEGAPHPTAILAVEDDEVLIGVDWTVRGGARSTYGAPATTTGAGTGTATRPVRLSAFIDLLSNVDPEGDLTIVVPRDRTEPLLVIGEGWRVALDPIPSGVLVHREHLGHVLSEEFGSRVLAVEDSAFAVQLAERTVVVELVDRPDEAVRCSTAVCTDIVESFEVMRQLNESNASVGAARMWIADGTVWATIEVPIATIDDICAVVRGLDHRVRGFDVFLGGLGVEA